MTDKAMRTSPRATAKSGHRAGSLPASKPLIAAAMACGLVLLPTIALAEGDFSQWLNGLRTEALNQGISKTTLDRALANASLIPRVIELDRRQPEGTITFGEYLDRVAPWSRIERGRRALAEDRPLLDEVAARYGVPPQYIVALWGIETDFGRNTGGFRVIDALATLAYDGRRSTYFRGELLAALRILDEGHISAEAMTGSWAGAMGQSQFMPSSFLAYAVDGNGDGRRDIWGTKADVFASAANYLANAGWVPGQTWGRRVQLPTGFDTTLASLDIRRPLASWRDAGVRAANGGELPVVEGMTGSVILPDGPGGPAFLVYDNYRSIMRWNRSTYFATTVGILADRIDGINEFK